MDYRYKVVDLFSGAGGLSLGFLQTKKYDIKVAFENSPYMQETYKKNHTGVEVQGDYVLPIMPILCADTERLTLLLGGLHVRAFQMQIVKKTMQSAKTTSL